MLKWEMLEISLNTVFKKQWSKKHSKFYFLNTKEKINQNKFPFFSNHFIDFGNAFTKSKLN